MSRKGTNMSQNNKPTPKNESIMISDERGVQLYLSDQAANRLAWFFTGILGILSLPVIILACISC